MAAAVCCMMQHMAVLHDHSGPAAILVVDDDEAIARLVGLYLRRLGHAADWFSEPALALEAARSRPYHLLLLDYQLPGLTGLELGAQLMRELQRTVPLVLMTAHGSVEVAVSAIRDGASDFITKPFELSVLQLVVERALAHHFTRAELERLQAEVRRDRALHGLVGDSPVMQRVRALIERLGPGGGAVLVTGESGTGKELVARALHAAGPRRDGPLVSINCGAISSTLLDSELFGHVRGAFTDAVTDRLGVFREAHGGTLLLDEVGELPLRVQVSLLRVLQERKVRPLGANREIDVDVRVVAATNADLHAAVARGAFREDLLFRLDVLRVPLPPLRERGDDVAVLLRHFLAQTCARYGRPLPTLAPQALAALTRHHWPGNVRELQNVVESAVLSHDGVRIETWHLPPAVMGRAIPVEKERSRPLLPLAEVERKHIARVLGAVGGNRKKAAEVLGIDRVTLYRKLKRG